MIDVVNSENRDQFDNMLTQMWQQRSDVFVDKLGWDLPVTDGMEIDAYDDDRSTYLLASKEGDEVTGSLRILPTTEGHLMADLFPEMCAGEPPVGPEVWEISRFLV